MPVKRNNNKKIKKDDQPKTGLKEKVANALELPKEIVLNIPKITMLGSGNIVIENYKGIIEYENCRIKINTGSGVVEITGVRLMIREITSEDILIEGEIGALKFMK